MMPGERRIPLPALALDTSTMHGTAALGWGGWILGERELPPGSRHAASLLPAIAELMEEAGLRPGELRGVVVGSGPGSFTGVRVAAATARGLARGAGIPLIPVSSLAGAAATLAHQEGTLCPCIDARGDRVFAAVYRVGRGGVEELMAPRATRIQELLEAPLPPGLRFAGDGAWRHREVLERAGFLVVEPPAGLPSARGLLRLAPGISPHPEPARWEPDYLKGAGVSPPRS